MRIFKRGSDFSDDGRPLSIKLITTACGDIRMLPEFSEYYTALGVQKIILNVIDTIGDGRIVEHSKKMLNETPHVIANVYVGQHSWPKQVELIQKAKADHCRADDWVLLPDLDELHDYRGNLHATLLEADKKGENLIVGEFLDRIASNGELIHYDPTKSVFEQFPVAAKISQDLLKASRLRTAAIRGNIDISKHFCTESDALVQAGIANGSVVVRKGEPLAVHHFKWHSQAVKNQKLLEHLAANEGRINLSDGSIRIVFKKDRRKDPVSVLLALGF